MSQDILFDASRLLSRTDRDVPTGIDRVCLAYAEWLINHPVYRMVPVRGRAGQLTLVDRDWFIQQIEAMRQRWMGQDDRPLRPIDQALIQALSATERPQTSILCPSPPTEAPKGRNKRRALRQFFRSRKTDTLPQALAYINVGHTALNDSEPLASLKKAGIPSLLMVHDLIPITHPEFCRPGDDAKHVQRMQHALTLGSHIIANSQATADELALFAKKNSLPLRPSTVAHLGLETRLQTGEPLKTARPYFIHVGTIEGRKNLAFLLNVWRRLEEEMGDKAPSLVLAGRYGWENEAVLDMLERCTNLRGIVHQISGAPDNLLSQLMRGANAVLAPSSIEGFDLPAVEASALGIPLIASDIAPHRELTPHARLIDPLDGPAWLQALKEWSHNPPPAPPFTAPSWKSHFEIVEAEIVNPLARSAL